MAWSGFNSSSLFRNISNRSAWPVFFGIIE
ncbi:hypothetical protein NIASO_04630 [Niabella soli DSM 19437]|uniref:Uncharacterized protein n=1 Tax=Niabella soli DSM 19437 TaxID=929713 RepID=W0F2K9_9BACT|nr:hypothetical protein NIASO_04630 [Niabella soli DSM 19437]